MKYGSPIHRKCKHCDAAIEIQPLLEGSHIGSVLWSDGYIAAPMMPEQAIVANCNNCHNIVWLIDLEEIDLLNQPQNHAIEIAKYKELTGEECLAYIKYNTQLPKERLVYMRTTAWQKLNMPRRRKNHQLPLSETEIENMIALNELLDEKMQNERLMKIEIYRELGDFEAAKKLINGVDFSSHITHITEQVINLIKAEDSTLSQYQTHTVAL